MEMTMGRRKCKLPPGIGTLPFADPDNLIAHITAFGNDHSYSPRKEPTPTDTDPGPDRVEVYAQRLLRGEDLWHDDDPVIDMESMASMSRFFDQPEDEYDD